MSLQSGSVTRRRVNRTLLIWLVCTVLVLAPGRVQASCRIGSTNRPLCCTGKQSHCYGFTIDFEDARVKRMQLSRKQLESIAQNVTQAKRLGVNLKRCFCDNSCTLTDDCCPDYRILCQKPVIDCQVSQWSNWTKCSNKCGMGKETRSRSIEVKAQNGGKECPVLKDERPCQGHECGRRRVRSNYVEIRRDHFMYPSEMAQIVPVRSANGTQLLQTYDMRFDVRRKLYYGRLLQNNQTEMPDPEPYSAIYELKNVSGGCKRSKFGRDTVFNLYKNEFICVTCFYKYMHRNNGMRCLGSNLGRRELRFRNLGRFDCHGTFVENVMYRGRDSCPNSYPRYAFL